MTSVVDRDTLSSAKSGRPTLLGDASAAPVDRAIDGVIVVFLGFLVPLVSLFRGHWLEYFLPIGLAFSFFHLLRRRTSWHDYFKAAPWWVFASVGGFIFLGFIAAWRVYDESELYESLRAAVSPMVVYLGLYGVIFFVMIRGTVLSSRILTGLLWGSILVSALLALEPFTSIASEWIFPLAHKTKEFSLAHFNRTFVALALFSWLAAPWLTKRLGHGVYGLLPPIAVWLLNFTGESDTVMLGLIPSAVIYLAALWRPRWVLNLAFAFVVAVLLSAPVLYPVIFEFVVNLATGDKFGFLVRAEIWDAVARFVMEAPVFGHGLGATFRSNTLEIANLYFNDTTIYHPHNAFLQVWADMGLLGALAMTGVIWAIWRGLTTVSDDRLPHILALFTFAIAAFVTTHSLWAAWWLGLLAMALAYSVATSGTVAPGQKNSTHNAQIGDAR